jgi:phenylalanyl-tRNA synthetase beta chain
VDISNYAMIMTGYPNHIFDAGKVVGGLVWHRAFQDDTFTTLDGTVLELTKGKELVISDNLGPLVLASAVGGRRSAISPRTTSVLAEVAVYDAVKVRTDARALKVVTEASNRLEKELSPEFTLWALEFLANCLVEIGGGKIASAPFDHYPKQNRVKPNKIQINADLPGSIAGIEIGILESERILKRLGFTTQRSGSSKLTVYPPSWRLDVEDELDVAEEIIRIKGFNTIKPLPPSQPAVVDCTPPTVKLAQKLRALLPHLGLDEVLSLPMVTSQDNRARSFWASFTVGGVQTTTAG